MRRNRFIPLFMALALVTGAPVTAELYRCEGPDGRAIFTDQKSACPEADEYVPDGRITNAMPKRVPGPARRQSQATNAEREEVVALQWRQRRIAAEQALTAVLERRAGLQPAITHCNRGGYVTVRDDAGIKRRMSCSVLKKEFAALEGHEARARDYLETGLAEECRKAGCLPGWIR